MNKRNAGKVRRQDKLTLTRPSNGQVITKTSGRVTKVCFEL